MRNLQKQTELPTPDSSKLCVLVVEDNEPSALVTTTFLDSYGYSFDIAKNGDQAVEKAKSGRYALILMDVTMPVMNGWEATRCIREFERGTGRKPLRIIGVTANTFLEDKDLCLSAGMDDYVPKPIDFDLLEKKLKTLL